MTRTTLRLHSGSGGEQSCWELFHENSKLGRQSRHKNPAALAEPDENSAPSAYAGFPSFDLAAPEHLAAPLDTVVNASRPNATMRPGRIWRETLAALLVHCSAGAARPVGEVPFIEIWFHSNAIDGMPVGLYRLDPTGDRIRLIRNVDLTDRILGALLRPETASRSAIQFFVVADLAGLSERHGGRGYRYAFVEAGRVARNLDLVAEALGLVTAGIGDFRDREIDALLALDGLARGTLYMIALGKTGRGSDQREPTKLGSARLGRRRHRRGRR